MRVIPIKLPNVLASKPCLVDDEDYEYLILKKWHGLSCQSDCFYAVRNRPKTSEKKRGVELMHRLIVDAPEGIDVDHKDGNGLNNQKSNLRFCSDTDNARNRKRRNDNSSGFKGVSFHKKTGKFWAKIEVNKKQKSLGLYPTAFAAARAYDEAAKTFFGEFARTNS